MLADNALLTDVALAPLGTTQLNASRYPDWVHPTKDAVPYHVPTVAGGLLNSDGVRPKNWRHVRVMCAWSANPAPAAAAANVSYWPPDDKNPTTLFHRT